MKITMAQKINDNFLSKKRFAKMIEDVVLEQGLSYMDAILLLCDQNNIEIEETKKYISPVIQSKLEAEAIRSNALKGSNTNMLV